MIKAFKDYEKVQAYGDYQRLPKGGYVVKILGVSVEENKNGQYLKLSCDITEGDFTGYFGLQYRNSTKEDKKWACNLLVNIPKDDGSEQDGWTKRRFKTIMEALEDSNKGYAWDWDETKLKGLKVGGLFNEREYVNMCGDIKTAVNLATFCSIEKIKDGSYQLPADKLLSDDRREQVEEHAAKPDAEGFVSVPDGVDNEALPFN